MAGASALICPSPYESLSITLLEGHVVRHARARFIEIGCPGRSLPQEPGGSRLRKPRRVHRVGPADGVERRPAPRAGQNGKRYALTEFSWESVLDRLVRQIDAAAVGARLARGAEPLEDDVGGLRSLEDRRRRSDLLDRLFDDLDARAAFERESRRHHVLLDHRFAAGAEQGVRRYREA